MTRALSHLAVLALVAAAVPAAAQSRRYPPAPVDKDAEAAARSELWTSATSPERHPYDALLQQARGALSQRTIDQTTAAIAKLDEAIALVPAAPDAYRMRGDAYFDRREWPRCAADLAAASARIQRDDDAAVALPELHRKLGICLAHAGKLGAAEQTLTEAVGSAAVIGAGSSEIWMRLGEVRLAMGKPDEAIAALRAALEASDPASRTMTRFLLAAAYDRARHPAEALLEAGIGVADDRALTTLYNPVMPALGPGDLDYLRGLAYTAMDPPRPELALAYFRRFVAAAPDSPWRKRADEHLRELKAQALPAAIGKTGTAELKPEPLRAAAHQAMPRMRACLAGRPTFVVEIEITKAGPRTPPTDRTRPRFFMPQEGIAVHPAVGELADDELAAIEHCLRPLAAQLPMPAARERDTFYKASFYVAGP